jgi:hypothetical protein
LSCQQRLLGQQCAAESDESTLGWNTLDVTELTVLMTNIKWHLAALLTWFKVPGYSG